MSPLPADAPGSATPPADPAGSIDSAEPTDAQIESWRLEIDRLDATILESIKRRSEISQQVGRARMAAGGTRLVHSREMVVLERFSDLGKEGHTLAMLLLRLGRGPLGR